MPEKPFGRTLVVRGGALGDFLLTLPAISSLRASSQHLEILGYPSFVELARDRDAVDAGRSIEYAPLAGFFARGAIHDPALRDYFASFHLVVSYLYDPDGIFAENLKAAGVKRFVQGPHKPSGRSHAIDELSTPLRELGVGLLAKAERLGPPQTASRQPVIALHPGSGSRTKNWASLKWRGLAEQILAAHPETRLAVIGGEADTEEVDALNTLRQNPRIEFWENLLLRELAGRLELACGYIGHDTGVSHLAAALGVPCLLLFGPTDPAIWAPPHEHVEILRAPDNDLSQLGVPNVLAAVTKLWGPGLLASARQNQQHPGS